MKGPPPRHDGPQVELHIWIDKIKEPSRILVRVENMGVARSIHEVAHETHTYLELARQAFAVEKFSILEDGSLSAKIDL